jgi:hypothetical protein
VVMQSLDQARPVKPDEIYLNLHSIYFIVFNL